SLDKNALETEITQLKDNITSLRIQNDGYKIEIANHTRRYLELSKASTHSRNTSNEKIAALIAEIAKMKPNGSGTKAPPTPRKKHVTFQEPSRVPTTHTKQPAINNHKQPNVNVIVSTGLTPAAEKPLVARPKMIPKNVRKTDITVAYRIVPQWKPTGRQFILCDIYGPKKSKAPTAKPLELSSSVSYSSHINVISRVYYVEGLSHNLFPVGQFCDGGLEVVFRQHTCHIRNMDKLWHRRLNHLNFGTLNELARNDLVRGLPLLKYDKDHLCPSCQLGKSKKACHPLKTKNSNKEIPSLLHMDLCGPMRTESINKKRYVLVIVDDYTRFGWVRFLRTKDETPAVFKKFLKNSQLALKATVRTVRTIMER
nr:hypothetical protein [Tanacetum cinerariifolium]